MSINKVFIEGHICNKPQLVTNRTGASMLVLTVATNNHHTKSDGERVEKPEYHRVVLFARLAEVVAKRAYQGGEIVVEGSLQTRYMKDHQGVETDERITEVIANYAKVTGLTEEERNIIKEYRINKEYADLAKSADGGDDADDDIVYFDDQPA